MAKIRVDKAIEEGKSNYKIKKLLDQEGFPENLIPENDQMTNRRSYMKKKILGGLVSNKAGGFYKWIKDRSINFQEADMHTLIILADDLSDDDFKLVLTTRALLQNAVKESKEGFGFMCMDTTHKLVTCRFKFTTIATATVNDEIADIGYILQQTKIARA